MGRLDARCHFGCDEPIYRVLLELPNGSQPGLCRYHSVRWKEQERSWPDDFQPWVSRMQEELEDMVVAPAVESRPPDTEILANEAIIGFWYTVPSGEIERCHGQRSRGRGAQVGFVGILDNGADLEDIRWLQGRTSVLVGDELKVAEAVRAQQHKPGKPLELDLALCPRNGLLCSVCELPQRETPSGPTCEQGHGGVAGLWRRRDPNSANPAAQDEADQRLPEGDLDLQAGGPSMSEQEIREAYPDAVASALEQLAARTADQLAVEPRKLAGPTAIFHKSLHIDWRTPKELFDAQVARWGPYWLDAAATLENKLCEYWLGPGSDVEDALSVDWTPTEEIVQQYGANIWLNHPYSSGEKPCKDPCGKKKCRERGYHIDKEIASSGEWMVYARDQAIDEALKFGGVLTCLTKRAGETEWWKGAIRYQPTSVGAFLTGRSDPTGGPAAEFMNSTRYKAATWTEFRWEHLIVDIVEIEGRVDFDRGGDDGSAGFPSAIVTYYKPGTR